MALDFLDLSDSYFKIKTHGLKKWIFTAFIYANWTYFEQMLCLERRHGHQPVP